MTRAVVLSVGWVGAVTSFWLCLLLLDIYLNLVSWHPRWDGTVVFLLCCTVAALVGITLLARATRERLPRMISLLLCLLLLALAIYAFPAEPLSPELFGRVESSPGWYRGTRVLVMGLPLAVWWFARRHSAPVSSTRT